MRIYLVYTCIAVIFISCTNSTGTVSRTSNLPANTAAHNVTGSTATTVAPDASGQECEYKRTGCWNSRVTLW